MAGGRDSPGRVVGRFLKQVADVPARPFPMNFVSTGGAIETFPPRQVGFATETSAHCFDDVAGVSEHFYVARLPQRFESDCRCNDLRLLIRRAAEIFADGAPETFVTEQSDRRRATRFLSVAQTRTVAKDCYLLERRHA